MPNKVAGFCRACGAINPSDYQFCSVCGANLKNFESVSTKKIRFIGIFLISLFLAWLGTSIYLELGASNSHPSGQCSYESGWGYGVSKGGVDPITTYNIIDTETGKIVFSRSLCPTHLALFVFIYPFSFIDMNVQNKIFDTTYWWLISLGLWAIFIVTLYVKSLDIGKKTGVMSSVIYKNELIRTIKSIFWALGGCFLFIIGSAFFIENYQFIVKVLGPPNLGNYILFTMEFNYDHSHYIPPDSAIFYCFCILIAYGLSAWMISRFVKGEFNEQKNNEQKKPIKRLPLYKKFLIVVTIMTGSLIITIIPTGRQIPADGVITLIIILIYFSVLVTGFVCFIECFLDH